MLIEFEAMLHASVQRVGRTVRNLRQESSDGYASKTPGSGEPGGGKGSGPTVAVRVERGAPWRRSQVDPARLTADERSQWEALQRSADRSVDRVPVSSTEIHALGLGEDDPAADVLGTLKFRAWCAADALDRLAAACGAERITPGLSPARDPLRAAVLAYARVLRIRRVLDAIEFGSPAVSWSNVDNALRDAEQSISQVFRICQTWGYDPKRPAPRKDRADLLAVDLTERWCTSHLRVGDRRERDRGELCQWCRKFEAAEGFVPPRELVQLHVDNRRVYDHEIAPFRQAHRDRMRQIAKPRS
jgi:hypothetical protein